VKAVFGVVVVVVQVEASGPEIHLIGFLVTCPRLEPPESQWTQGDKR
jgi:hypothetical protein